MSLLNIDLSLENAGRGVLGSGVTTFAQVFARGELSGGTGLVANLGGRTSAVQLDVKTTYDDGSVKMAVLSLLRPDLAAGQSVDVALSTTAASAASGINLAQAISGHSFEIDIVGQGGKHEVDVLGALREALANGTASTWQTGALASQARVEVPLDGSQRLIFDVTVYAGGGMKVDAQFNNDGAMGANGGRVSYHVTATMDGEVVMRQSVNQDQYQNWHESFSTTNHDGGQGLGSPSTGWLNIAHDAAHLETTGAIADYNLSLGVSEARLSAWGATAQSNGFGDPLAANDLVQYMPTTGGRDDIGFTTAANTAWLMTQDPRAAAYALGQAEAASAIPWHLWDSANKEWLSADTYPHLWTDARGGTGTPGNVNSGGLTQQIGTGSGWTLDSAHQPDVSYVPYLLTGERWMLDNLQAQASWNIVNTWSDSRGAEGEVVVNGGQVRHSAWALRQIDEAAWASPDGSAQKSYFTEASKANWAWLVEQIPAWTAAQGEAHGWLPGDYGTVGALPPWQQDYFASTAIAAASHGNADALKFLEWQSNFLIGRFTHEGQGFELRDGAAYLIAISDPATGKPYSTWAEIGAHTVANDWSNGNSWARSDGDYGALALATLAGIAHLTGSAAAAAAYNALLAEAPPHTTADAFFNDPIFAIAAPGSLNLPIPEITVPVVTVPVVTVPVVTVPEITVPEVTVPIVTVPVVTVPEITVPVVTVPTVPVVTEPVTEAPSNGSPPVVTPTPTPQPPVVEAPKPEVPAPTPTLPSLPDLPPGDPNIPDASKYLASGGLLAQPDHAQGLADLSLVLSTFGFVDQGADISVSIDGRETFHGVFDPQMFGGSVVVGHVDADVAHNVMVELNGGPAGSVVLLGNLLLGDSATGLGSVLVGDSEANFTVPANHDVFAF